MTFKDTQSLIKGILSSLFINNATKFLVSVTLVMTDDNTIH